MAINVNDKKWLQEMGAKAVLQKALQDRQATKDAVIARAAASVALKAKEIHAGMNQKATREGDKKKGALSLLDAKGRGSIAEFDWDEMQDGYALDEDAHVAQLKAQHIAEQIQKEFDVEVDKIDPDTGEVVMKEIDELDANGAATGNKIKVPEKQRLFDDKELGPALYQPMVRQGLLPETLVPDRYSAVKSMREGSFDAYAERLKNEKPKGFWGENKGLIIQSVKTVGALGAAGGTINSAANVSSNNAYEFKEDNYKSFFTTLADAKNSDGETDISSATDLIAFTVGLASTTNEARIDLSGGDDEEPEDVDSAPAQRKARAALVAQQMVTIACATLAGEIDSVAPDLGIVVSSAFGALVKAPILAGQIRDADAAGLKAQIGSAYAKAILACDPKTATSTAELTTAGGAMNAAFDTGLDTLVLQAALDAANLIEALDLVNKAAAAAAKAGTARPQFKQEIADPANRDAMRKGMAASVDKVFQEAQAEQRAADLAEEEAMEEERALKADGMKIAGLIDRKIKALKKEQMLIKWAASMAGLGFDIASKVIAPLAIGGSAVAMAQNILLAVQRTRDFAKWTASHGDMIRGASPYSSAVANFTTNAAVQALHYEINAAIELVKIIGAVTECSGLAVAAGKAVQAGAAIAGAVEALLYEAKKRYDLEVAWTQYRRALTRPDNRKLALIAIRDNPTLAKYAVAWGCYIVKDPLVGDFMHKCGLNAETMQDEDANVEKVVEYLETRMPDDIVVVGRDVAVGNWAPSPIKLSSLCWASAKNRGVKDAGLRPMETRAVDAALFGMDQLYKDLAAKPVPVDKVKSYLLLLDSLDRELGGLRPIHETERIQHREMQDVIDALKAAASARRAEVAALLVSPFVSMLDAQADALDQAAGSDSFDVIKSALEPAREQMREVVSASLDKDPRVKAALDTLTGKFQDLSQALVAMESWKSETPDWNKDIATNWEAAKKKAKLKQSTHLTAQLKAAKAALVTKGDSDAAKKKAVDALQKVIDNIDMQLGGSPDPGLALYLRKVKSGARALMA